MSQTAPGLYLVTPPLKEASAFLPLLAKALGAAQIASVLLRLDEPDEAAAVRLIREVAEAAQAQGAALLIDSDPTLVLKSGADGVHIGVSGEPLRTAIKKLSPGHIVGAGGLSARHEAMEAGEVGADYVLFGDWDAPLEPLTLLERVAWWAEIFNTPSVALAQNLREVGALAAAGADFVMLGDCIWADPRGPDIAVKEAQRAVLGQEA
jgi:thiamine-phosphate pyrophosphorylase